MNANQGTSLWRELALAHAIPCELIFAGSGVIQISVPVKREIGRVDLSLEEEAVILDLCERRALTVEKHDENILIY